MLACRIPGRACCRGGSSKHRSCCRRLARSKCTRCRSTSCGLPDAGCRTRRPSGKPRGGPASAACGVVETGAVRVLLTRALAEPGAGWGRWSSGRWRSTRRCTCLAPCNRSLVSRREGGLAKDLANALIGYGSRRAEGHADAVRPVAGVESARLTARRRRVAVRGVAGPGREQADGRGKEVDLHVGHEGREDGVVAAESRAGASRRHAVRVLGTGLAGRAVGEGVPNGTIVARVVRGAVADDDLGELVSYVVTRIARRPAVAAAAAGDEQAEGRRAGRRRSSAVCCKARR